MEDDIVGERREETTPRGPRAVVEGWRRSWREGVAEAEGPDGDSLLSARRRDYGQYPFLILDIGLIALLVILANIIIAVVAYIALSSANHGQVPANAQQQLTSSPVLNSIGIVAIDGPIILGVWYRVRRLRLGWAVVGLGRALKDGLGRAILVGIGIGIAAIVLSNLIGILLEKIFKLDMSGQDKILIEPLRHAPIPLVLVFVLLGTFLAPFAEELLFRGYLFRALATRKGMVPAYAGSAGLFALVHLASGPGLLPLLPALFAIGLLLCFAYHSTGNVAADITAHVVNNAISFIGALLFHM